MLSVSDILEIILNRKYQRIPTTGTKPETNGHDGLQNEYPVRSRSRIGTLILALAAVLFSGGVGFILGYQMKNPSEIQTPPVIMNKLHTFPRSLVTWEPNETYMGIPNAQNNAAWRSLVPEPDVLWVENPEELGLAEGIQPYGIDKPTKNFYAVSAVHQIHCLSILRNAYYNALSLMSWDDPNHVDHVDHCFEYLRLAATCSGDLTLEHKDVIPATTISGWHANHSCIDYEALLQYHRDQGRLFYASPETPA
ncbi:hypothetical protein F5884DRAFT_902233 [Xylogone sp. PMI_703]|nr:hypothetical protein F5884DRAFT_902233 [Xylogone sp. PMI_703]